jgi:CRISPR-associated endonuclease Cas1
MANKIVAAKLRTLGLHPADARGFRQELAEARKLDDILTIEARAGAAHFMQFRGTEMLFKGSAPDHWRVFTARSGSLLKGKGGTSKARHAATPFGAMLNYAYAIALGQCTRAIIGTGLDPCMGFLHSPKPGRLSLSYDVLELHRAETTAAVFEYAQKRAFKRNEFQLSAEGVARLTAPIARDVTALVLKETPFKDYVASVRKVIAWF